MDKEPVKRQFTVVWWVQVRSSPNVDPEEPAADDSLHDGGLSQSDSVPVVPSLIQYRIIFLKILLRLQWGCPVKKPFMNSEHQIERWKCIVIKLYFIVPKNYWHLLSPSKELCILQFITNI